MNQILELRGKAHYRSSPGRPGAPNLPVGKYVQSVKLEQLKNNLTLILSRWKNENLIKNILINVNYIQIIAKSNRVNELLQDNPEEIVGARYSGDGRKHIITHYVSRKKIKKAIDTLNTLINILNESFDGVIDASTLKAVNNNELKGKISFDKISKSRFSRAIVDSYYVEFFNVPEFGTEMNDESIVTIFETDAGVDEIFRKIGIELSIFKKIDNTTYVLNSEEYSKLWNSAPYLISMATKDISEITKSDITPIKRDKLEIIKPSDEPIIGVIDTLFDTSVYFSEWVDYENMLVQGIDRAEEDFDHGTSITSIIVDGPRLNPELDDGCGRFRVKHFGVATASQFSSFSIIRSIRKIISTNRDIKVWNLSLGSYEEINNNYISPVAAELDRIQYEHDVLFVVAGTNYKKTLDNKLLGSPADSINSIVVNAVDFNDKPTYYTRRGPVLTYFFKPDVSYYGGDEKKQIRVFGPKGISNMVGTSCAAPWIARKAAYLIYVMGFTREVTKALILDTAARWNGGPSKETGYGIVPKRIEDILYTPNDEIRFVINWSSEKYETYNFDVPVPIVNNRHPYITKATMCYYPKCTRNQGVDYTNTELDIRFGRVTESGLKTINDNTQDTPEARGLFEEVVRKELGKWSNSKHIVEKPKLRGRPKKVYKNGLWGISVKSKERLKSRDGHGINFGLVVTMKEMNGENRIDEFIRSCLINGWFVNRVEIKQRLDIYVKAEEKIDFSLDE